MNKDKRKLIFYIIIIVVIFVLVFWEIDQRIGTNLGGAIDEIIRTADMLQTLETDEEKEVQLTNLQKKLIHYHTEIRGITSKFPYRGYYIQELVFFLQDVRRELPTEEAAQIVVEMADYIVEIGIIDITSKKHYMYMIDPLGARTKLESVLKTYNASLILVQ